MFLDYLAQEGFRRKLPAPYSQQRSGVSERCNRTLLYLAQSMPKHAGMPKKHWAEAAVTAVYVKNRPPSRDLPNMSIVER